MKNLLLFSTLLLTTAAAFAQLTVKPNGSSDSYVYVKNQVLYVDDYVNLTENPTAATKASIYLREDGQMIQGGTTSNNTGNGFLSAQQTSPETNAFAYYLWCSPVGNPTIGSGTGNTNFGVHSIYDSTGSTSADAVNITTGRDGTMTSPITISTRWLYTLTTPGTEAEANYVRMYAGNAAPPGFGFTMKGVGYNNPGIPQLYDFRGRPNSGDFVIPVAGPVGTFPNVNAQMTLTGNPYPSALDLNKLYYDTSNGDLGAIYFYDEDRTVMSHYYRDKPFGYGVWEPNGKDDTPNNPLDFPGIYTQAPFYIWTAAGGSNGTGNYGSDDQHRRYAPIGQGFMLVGKNSGTEGSVTIKNSHRVFIKQGTGTNSVFHRPGNDTNISDANNNLDPNNPAGAEIEPHQIDYRPSQMRLWVVFDQEVTRDLVLTFSDQATDGYDRGFDGASPMGLKTDAFFPIATDSDVDIRPYVINAVKYDYGKQIPITFTLNKQTTFSVNVVEEVKKPYENAYLYDNVEHTYKRINNGGTITGARGATYTLPAGTYDDRFFIVFRAPQGKGDGPDPLTKKKNDVLANVTFFQNNPQRQLEVTNPEGYDIKSASMYDMNGKMVISESNLGDSKKLSFYTGNLSNGVYLVKLTTQDDITIDYKAIVYNK